MTDKETKNKELLDKIANDIKSIKANYEQFKRNDNKSRKNKTGYTADNPIYSQIKTDIENIKNNYRNFLNKERLEEERKSMEKAEKEDKRRQDEENKRDQEKRERQLMEEDERQKKRQDKEQEEKERIEKERKSMEDAERQEKNKIGLAVATSILINEQNLKAQREKELEELKALERRQALEKEEKDRKIELEKMRQAEKEQEKIRQAELERKEQKELERKEQEKMRQAELERKEQEELERKEKERQQQELIALSIAASISHNNNSDNGTMVPPIDPGIRKQEDEIKKQEIIKKIEKFTNICEQVKPKLNVVSEDNLKTYASENKIENEINNLKKLEPKELESVYKTFLEGVESNEYDEIKEEIDSVIIKMDNLLSYLLDEELKQNDVKKSAEEILINSTALAIAIAHKIKKGQKEKEPIKPVIEPTPTPTPGKNIVNKPTGLAIGLTKLKHDEEEAKRKGAEEEAKKKADEEEAKKKADDEAKKKAAEEEAKKKADEDVKKTDEDIIKKSIGLAIGLSKNHYDLMNKDEALPTTNTITENITNENITNENITNKNITTPPGLIVVNPEEQLLSQDELLPGVISILLMLLKLKQQKGSVFGSPSDSVVDDHLHKMCKQKFLEQFEDDEEDDEENKKEAIYTSHDDDYCYGMIIHKEDGENKRIENVKCKFNKKYVPGTDKEKYKVNKCHNEDDIVDEEDEDEDEEGNDKKGNDITTATATALGIALNSNTEKGEEKDITTAAATALGIALSSKPSALEKNKPDMTATSIAVALSHLMKSK